MQLNEMKSGIQNVTCGVPQGSILDPKLFLLCITDICNASNIIIIIIIMVIFKCYFSGELIALTKKKYYQQQQQQQKKKKDEALFKQTELDKAANSIN